MHGVRVHNNNSGKFLTGKQVFPVTPGEVEEASRRLVNAVNDGDSKLALDLLNHPFVDVDFVDAVNLRSMKAELVPNGELAHKVVYELEEFLTDVTALFLAAHSGNLMLVKKLLSFKADVNKKLFRGYATTAAVRSGHIEILEVLLKAGVCQSACEEALLEASYMGRPRHAELLMGSNIISPQVAVHALVSACCRGFLDVIQVLIKCGVDANAMDRMLLLSSKPYLHLNVDCNALVAAIVSRQVSVVELLLKEGVRADTKVRLGAWSWDPATGEECRVGAGLAEPYDIAWCAVEYFEETGSILRLLLQHLSPNTPHLGRTLIYHAILCNNAQAIGVLLSCGADVEFPFKTSQKTEIRPIHLGARLGEVETLWRLITAGCNINSETSEGETAVMICTRHKHKECLKALASAGADFGLVNAAGESANSIAGSTMWTLGFQQVILDVIRSGKVVRSSNVAVFSSILFVVRSNEFQALKILTKQPGVALDEQDENGFTAAMVAAASGQVEAFRLLVYSGADVAISNNYGETALSLSEASCNRDVLEKIMLDYALKNGSHGPTSSYALHCAARQGELASVQRLASMGYDVNAFDGDGYTPLMLAAKEGYGSICQFLISRGAKCEIENERHETPLSLTRKNGVGNEAEHVILDELSRVLVLCGTWVKKYTKEGKGAPHWKKLKMYRTNGVLHWGKSGKRNVICRAADVGPTTTFLLNRPKACIDKQSSGLFHIVTSKNKEVQFACNGGMEVAKLWVRGIKLVTREAIFGKTTLRAMFNQELGS
ncbi:Ankyrin-3 [Bienertia sinuspersici]